MFSSTLKRHTYGKKNIRAHCRQKPQNMNMNESCSITFGFVHFTENVVLGARLSSFVRTVHSTGPTGLIISTQDAGEGNFSAPW